MRKALKSLNLLSPVLNHWLSLPARMGIEWHVLVDGDEAGKKYAATVRGLLNNDREEERDHLTMLPAAGYGTLYVSPGGSPMSFIVLTQIPENVPMNMRKISSKAIHRSSKPDLAIEVAMEAGRRGVDAVPTLLRKMFFPRTVAGTRQSGLVAKH